MYGHSSKFSDQDDTDFSDDDVYKPEEYEIDTDSDSDFNVSKLKRKVKLESDNDLPSNSKRSTKRSLLDNNSARQSGIVENPIDWNIRWNDAVDRPPKKIKPTRSIRNTFDTSSEDESEDERKEGLLLKRMYEESKSVKKKGKNKAGLLDVLNDDYYNHASNPKKKAINETEFSDVEEYEEGKEEDELLKLLDKLKDNPPSDSDEEAEQAVMRMIDPKPSEDTKKQWFHRFDRKIRNSIMEHFPSYTLNEINRLIGQMWNNLSEEDKAAYKVKDVGYPMITFGKKSSHINVPKRPSGNGYIIYSKEQMPKIRKQFPHLQSVNRLSSLIGASWKILDQESKDEYNARAKREREEWIRKYPEAHEKYLQQMKEKIKTTKKARGEKKQLKKLYKEMRRSLGDNADETAE